MHKQPEPKSYLATDNPQNFRDGHYNYYYDAFDKAGDYNYYY